MNKFLSTVAIVAFVITLSACGESPDKSLSADQVEEQMLELSEKVESGEITGEKAAKVMKKLQSNSETKSQELSKTVSNISEFKTVPAWAKKMGVPEVNGLKLDPTQSTVVEAGNGYIQHFEAVYTGDKEEVLVEAKRIGEKLGLKKTLEMEGLLTLEGNLVDGYTSTVQVTYDSKGEANLLYNVHAEIVNSVQKPN